MFNILRDFNTYEGLKIFRLIRYTLGLLKTLFKVERMLSFVRYVASTCVDTED